MDGLCLKAGIHGLTTPITVAGIGALNVRPNPTHVVSAVGRSSSSAGNSISAEKPPAPTRTTSSWGFSFGQSLRSLWPGSGGLNRHDAIAVNEAVSVEETEEWKDNGESAEEARDGEGGSWVLNILHMRSLWSDELEWKGSEEDLEPAEEQEEKDKRVVNENGGEVGSENCTVCDAECDDGCVVDDHGKTIQFDNDSFSRLLKRVSLAEAKLYSQMGYLGNLAYSIPKIKPGRLLKYYGLRFVTSSLEKKEQPLKAEKEKDSSEIQESKENTMELIEGKEERISRNNISASTAYRIAASAASYLHSHTSSIIPFKSLKAKASKSLSENGTGSTDNVHTMNQEVASLIATTDSVTAVVAAKEEVKQAVADDLSSTRSSPCEWFICDDDRSATRFFIIQGSESLASWKANLLFEPVQFEGLNVLVHRGIYEAAKGIYAQMLPEVHSHLNSQGDRATFRFTGHSLGGSLSLLINLMLLIRSEVPLSSLLPVITFGAPSIMCGGNRLLRDLGLPQNHLQAITMHRDIVPRAFSCNYPSHVAEFLKAVNWNFRNHPCLNKQKLLYAPMGECLILQPEEKFSPNHHLLPSGSGLYLLSCPVLDASEAEKQIRAALSVFLNSPHPLEILSDRSAYGSEGTIQRDHDMDSYTRSLRNVYRQELNLIKKARKEERRKIWWPLVILHDINSGFILGRPVGTLARDQVNFYGIVGTSRVSWKQFNRLVSSRHMHMLMAILLPAQLLILGVYRLYRVIRLC